jgi:3'-5' exoribonuclease
MKYIEALRDGDRVTAIYLCRSKATALTKNGKEYENVVMQDKTGSIDCKIWEPGSFGIGEFEPLDYVEVTGRVTLYNGNLQFSIERARKCEEGEYDPKEYLPCSKKDIDEMYAELKEFIASIQNTYLRKLAESFFVEDEAFAKSFCMKSAAKSIHHGFMGGLLEHTLSVTKLCSQFAAQYPILNRDLLITAAMFHDIGKVQELSSFPANDYTDDGQLLGHIVIGSEMIHERAKEIPEFPQKLESELKHCVLAHHGELEYGSPKKPALVEAVALSLADMLDARMETFTEIFDNTDNTDWLGFNRVLDSNIRKTGK